MRQLTAVVFADIAGFTSLMERDEKAGLQAVTDFQSIARPIVLQHEGKWHKDLGDGALLSFGSSVDAIRAALQLQKKMTDVDRFQIRIGIHLGDVTFRDGDIYGNGVNVASRVQGLAQPGSVVLTSAVYDSALGHPDLQFRRLGYRDIKGVSEKILVYEINPSGTSGPVEEKTSNAKIRTLVVLPFADMSRERDQEYFCDGISEEIINALTKIEGLKVIARTSAFSFKGKNHDVRDIARQLDVQYVLEGSIRKSGSRLRITAQLIDASDGSHIWSEKFDRDLVDVFALQDEIALSILRTLEVTLFPKERQQVTKRHTENIDAFVEYLKGMYHFNKFSIFGAQAAIQAFERALEIDPEYSLAYAGLANVYGQKAYWAFDDPGKNFAITKSYLDKAVQLDPSNGYAYSLLGVHSFVYIRDWDASAHFFEKAISLDPRNTEILTVHALLQFSLNELEAGQKTIDRALELDPLSSTIKTVCCFPDYAGGNLEIAKSRLKAVVADDPDFPIANWYLWRTLSLLGKEDEAMACCRKVFPLWGSEKIPEFIAEGYRQGGYKGAMLRCAEGLQIPAPGTYSSPYDIAIFYRHAGDLENCLLWLQKAAEKNDPRLHLIGVEVDWQAVHGRSEYAEVLQAIHLDPTNFLK